MREKLTWYFMFLAWVCMTTVGFGQAATGASTASVRDTSRVESPVAAKSDGHTPPYNIILLTPDQMRADYMHTYDYPLKDTPNIDRLAQEGTLFLRAYSSGAWTTPSFGAILTGLFPTVHGMTLPPYESCGPSVERPLTNGTIPAIPPDLVLSPHKPIIPELLKSHGMTTAVDIANCWAIWDVISRGWDSVKFVPEYQLPDPDHPGSTLFHHTAPDTTRWAQQWLTSHRGRRFFLWVHYMEPHSSYNAPHQYDIFNEPDDYPNLYDERGKGQRTVHDLARVGNERAVRRLEQLYAAKILYADHYIGELLDTVRALGLKKNTIVIFVSDHGQLLYSHPQDFNMDGHRSIYDADLHVPLIFWGAGIPAGRRVDAVVGQYDLLPTILNLENLPVPSFADGKSLKPALLENATRIHRYVYSEETILEPQYSIRDSRYKVIETMRTGATQCFDDATDPREMYNICTEIPRKAAQLKAALDQHIQAMIRQAKSYPDWKNNFALAVLEHRDSKGLNILAPRELIVQPRNGAHMQLTGRLWSAAKGTATGEQNVFVAPPGGDTASVIWRSDTPLIGEYEISIRYPGLGQSERAIATDASYMVRYRGGTVSFPIDQNQRRAQWIILGHFRDPISVELTNQADGDVIAGSVRFRRVGPSAP